MSYWTSPKSKGHYMREDVRVARAEAEERRRLREENDRLRAEVKRLRVLCEEAARAVLWCTDAGSSALLGRLDAAGRGEAK
jgi:hypothetical protein